MRSLLALGSLLLCATGFAQDRMDWWRDARFGLFLHWGLYAIPAGAWEGRTDHGEWIQDTARIPLERYRQFQAGFDPKRYDPRLWMRLAKAAGMRYAVLTSKHHDGFCLFDSRHTGYDVMGTPYGKDALAEYVEAARAASMRVGLYHSILDWSHPDYLPRRPWEDRDAQSASFDRYVDYLHGQVTELLTNYGPIDILWFDGEWESTWTHQHGVALFELCRRLQPSTLVNNRVDKGRRGMSGMTAEGGFLGDFGTPEQEIPDHGPPGIDWESCMTMNAHWGFNRADSAWKSRDEILRMLADVASKGGNLLLNIGPDADGAFPEEAVRRLGELAGWMDRHSESIHAVRGSPLEVFDFGRITVRTRDDSSTLYLHVWEWPKDGVIALEGIRNPPISAVLLSDRERPVAVERAPAGLLLAVGSTPPAERLPVIRVDVSGRLRAYRKPVIRCSSEMFLATTTVAFEGAPDNRQVRYTTDGADPTSGSPQAEGPVTIDRSCTVKAAIFDGPVRIGPVGAVALEKVAPRPADAPDDDSSRLVRRRYRGAFSKVPDFARLDPLGADFPREPTLSGSRLEEDTAHLYLGALRIPDAGIWTLALESDDGALLWLGDELLVDNDGLHTTRPVSAKAALDAGRHRIRIGWFNRTGSAHLRVLWARDGGPLEPVPPEAWK